MNMHTLEDFFQNEKISKIEKFKRLNLYAQKGKIVFAGSSLMEHFPINEFLVNCNLQIPIYNRGVGGFTCDEFLQNINQCVLELMPTHLFINIGTNDLNMVDYNEDDLIKKYETIIKK